MISWIKKAKILNTVVEFIYILFYIISPCPDQIKTLLDQQETLYQRQSELKALLENFESSRHPDNDATANSIESWSGEFEWDTQADDIMLNVFGISTYRANQRKVGQFLIIIIVAPNYFFFFFFLSLFITSNMYMYITCHFVKTTQYLLSCSPL